MKIIDEALEGFLAAQKKRLKQRTYRDYKEVIDLFQIYLNGYGYQYLEGQDLEKWESHLENDKDSFTKLFDITKINYSTFSEFFEYFIIRKVASGESFMKQSVRVMKKLTDWLFKNNAIDKDKFDDLKDYFEDGKSTTLSNAEKVSDLVCDLSRKEEEFEYEETLEGYFTIAEIKQGKLWMRGMVLGDPMIGPIIVTKQISDLCKEGWEVSLVIGKHQNEWKILESGNIYPN